MFGPTQNRANLDSSFVADRVQRIVDNVEQNLLEAIGIDWGNGKVIGESGGQLDGWRRGLGNAGARSGRR